MSRRPSDAHARGFKRPPLSQSQEIDFVREQFQQILQRRDRLIAKQDDQIAKLQKLILTRTRAYDDLAKKFALSLAHQSNVDQVELKQDIIVPSFDIDQNNVSNSHRDKNGDSRSQIKVQNNKDTATVSVEFKMSPNEINALKLDFTKKIAQFSRNIGQHCTYLKMKTNKDQKLIHDLRNEIDKYADQLNHKQRQIDKLQIEKKFLQNQCDNIKSSNRYNDNESHNLESKELQLVIADLQHECNQLNKVIQHVRSSDNDTKSVIFTTKPLANLSQDKRLAASKDAKSNIDDSNPKNQLLKEIQQFKFENNSSKSDQTKTIELLTKNIEKLKTEKAKLMNENKSLNQIIESKDEQTLSSEPSNDEG